MVKDWWFGGCPLKLGSWLWWRMEFIGTVPLGAPLPLFLLDLKMLGTARLQLCVFTLSCSVWVCSRSRISVLALGPFLLALIKSPAADQDGVYIWG